MYIYNDISIPPLQFQHIPINMPLPHHVPFIFDNILYPINDAPMSGVNPGSEAGDFKTSHILIKRIIPHP